MRRLVMTCVLSTLLLNFLPAADWPQWRGAKRDGLSPEVGVKKGLIAKGGPKLAWTFDAAGMGCGTVSVVGDKIYLMGNRKGDEFVIALNTNGKELWASKLGPVWDFPGNTWTAGPNCTPTIEGDRLYALTSKGMLGCLDSTNGKEIWSVDVVKTLGGSVTKDGGGPETYGWGFSWSPLIDGDKLIVTPGGKQGLFAALEKKTGEVIWQSKALHDNCTYASPVVAEIGGIRQYITMTQEGIVSVDAKTGDTLWYYKRAIKFKDMVCTTPLVLGEQVFFTATQAGAELLDVKNDGGKFMPKRVNLCKTLSNFHGGVVQVGKHVYASHESRDWKCVEIATGEVAWSTQEFGAGPVGFADGVLILQSEGDDEIAIIEPDPAGYKELNRWKLPMPSKLRKPSTRLWTPPVVAAGKLFVRDQDLLHCYDLK